MLFAHFGFVWHAIRHVALWDLEGSLFVNYCNNPCKDSSHAKLLLSLISETAGSVRPHGSDKNHQDIRWFIVGVSVSSPIDLRCFARTASWNLGRWSTLYSVFVFFCPLFAKGLTCYPTHIVVESWKCCSLVVGFLMEICECVSAH